MAEYNQLTPELIAELENIVGGDNCLTGEDINEDYSHDEMPIYGTHMPDAVVLPANTNEVSAIMKLASANNIPVTVRGAGTGLVGGSTPLAGGIALCTMRMDKILEYDENNLFVRVQPGVRLCDLAADAIDHGFMYPPDPGEKTGSIGGNVSTNAGGMRAVKYGTTRDYVLAMTVVREAAIAAFVPERRGAATGPRGRENELGLQLTALDGWLGGHVGRYHRALHEAYP